jgi:hypothetical protein
MKKSYTLTNDQSLLLSSSITAFPSKKSIAFIMGYSRSLMVIKTQVAGDLFLNMN